MILGIDIGGSHITAALVDKDSHLLIRDSYRRIHFNSKGTAEEIINAWSDLINEVFEKNHILNKKIGIAMPGPFNYEKGVSMIKGLDKYESLYQLNVKELLASKLEIRSTDILMMNDAAAFLQGEVHGGAAIGYQDVIGITLGTGTGTAVHRNGTTRDANLGPSPFMDSIADDYFSTRWFLRRYMELTGKLINDVKAIAKLYPSEVLVKELFLEFTKNLALFIQGFVEKEKPQIIILGGNIALSSNLFLPQLESNLRKEDIKIPIMLSKLGEDAAILGAASLFKSKSVVL
jgi:glucokinase